MLVMKFGGTSVRDATAMRNVASIVLERSREQSRCVVVLSATAGTTNTLLSLAQRAASGRTFEAEFQEFVQRHLDIARDLGVSTSAIEVFIGECREHLEAAANLGECTSQTYDAVAGFGELLSTTLFALYLASLETEASWIDARRLIITNDEYQSATVDMDKTQAAVDAHLTSLLVPSAIVVTQGFVGCTAQGIPTTLGRGGSDYSASLLGRCLGATEIQIWTDVSGIYTCDPRIVSDATPLSEISFDDVHTLALYGAKVLHPETVLPAVEAGIPVRVLNTFEPDAQGTIITSMHSARSPITALAVLRPCFRIHIRAEGADAIMSHQRIRDLVALRVDTKSGNTMIAHLPTDESITDIHVALVGHTHTIDTVACIALCGADVTSPATIQRIAAQLGSLAETTVTSVLAPACALVTVPIDLADTACRSLHQLVSSSLSAS